MAVCVVFITERGRNCLGVTLLLLNLSLAMIAFILVIVGIALSFIFNQQKDLLQDFNYRTKTDLVMFSGIALMIFHLLGAKLSSDFGNIQTRQRSLKLAFPFLGLLFVAVLVLIFESILASRAAATMEQSSEKAFLNLMESYHSDKDKKKQVDRIQITHKCCGSTGYKDWMEMVWFSEEYTRPELRGTNFHGVPFTCCDPTYPGPCLHDTGDHQLPGFRKDGGKSFYSDGCSEVATVTLRWMLKNLAVWLLLPVWLELVILVLIKYLHSSIRSAIDSGDETGNGYGYLMERCPLHCFEFCETDIHALQSRKVNRKE